MPSRLADLIRRARRLAAERDRLIESLAAGLDPRPARPAAVGLRPRRAVGGSHRGGGAPGCGGQRGPWTAQAWRAEAQEVIGRVRAKVEAALRER